MYLSGTELRKLLSHVQEKADVARRRGTTRAIVDEVLILLLLNTGLRITELCNLRIRDLVTEKGSNTIKVRDSLGNVSRSIEVTQEMAEYLRTFIALYRRGAKSDDPLLVSERGGRFTYMSIYSKVKRIGRQAGLGNLNPRILRSTYVVRLYNREQNLQLVQQQAGHASLRTTAIYAIAAKDCGSPLVGADKADSRTASDAHSTGKKPVADKDSAERAKEPKETVSASRIKAAVKCEVCGRQIGFGAGKRIDSGQILCSECLEELHSK